MTAEVDLLSCCPSTLYNGGGFYDPFYDLDALKLSSEKYGTSIEILDKVFSKTISRRSEINCLSGEGAQENRSVLQRKTSGYDLCPPSMLIRIKKALIWNNMLFALDGMHALPIYETYRWPDRGEQGENLQTRLPVDRQSLDLGQSLFVGSSGSFNYGHWLVDDFARMSVLTRPELKHSCSVIMSSFNPPSDNVRREGAELFLQQSSGSVRVLDRTGCYTANDLLYVTPISYHPSVKNTEALAFTRKFLLAAAGPIESSSEVVFINRALGWPRQITNLEEIRSVGASIGARELLCESLPLLDQVRALRGAKKTFGIMGAAMTNQIFQPVASPCLHISPSGWDDPFYWDLSSQLSREYYVEFGPADEASHDRHFLRSFSFDASKLRSFLVQ